MRCSSFAVLRLLADGSVRSGEVIARALHVTRGTVWRAVRDIETHGLKVRRARGRGYWLEAPFDALDGATIRRKLGGAGTAAHLALHDECPSTNALLLRRAAEGAPSGAAIVCELQTAGRGRRGSRWISGLGDALTFSLLWRFPAGPAALGGLSLAIGVACVRALERLGCNGVALKWPNDLVLNGAKLGGILIELTGETRTMCAAVIGVGINVRLRESVRAAIAQPVTDLAQSGAMPARNDLAAALLGAVLEAACTFAQSGFAAFRAEWQLRHAMHGAQVQAVLADRRILEGVAVGVAEDGALLVETPRGVARLHAGDVRLRPVA